MAISEKQIREIILEKIQDVCPDARRIRRNPFTQAKSEWIGIFTHEIQVGSITKAVTHAWVVRRTSYTKGIITPPDKMVFELLGFYGFEFGSSETNSEDRWQKIIDDLTDELCKGEMWSELPDECGEDEVSISDIIFNPIGLIKVGENAFIHFAGGRMTVNVIRC